MNIPRTEFQSPVKNTFIVAVFSIGTSIAMFFASMFYIIYVKSKGMEIVRNRVMGANFLISMVVLSVSAYQCLISVLLFIHARSAIKRQPVPISVNNYLCFTYLVSVWYISHLNILPIYWALFILELVTSIESGNYILLGIATLFTIGYQCIFTYFVVVTYRFLKLHSMINLM